MTMTTAARSLLMSICAAVFVAGTPAWAQTPRAASSSAALAPPVIGDEVQRRNESPSPATLQLQQQTRSPHADLTQAPATATPRPVYRRWWFWTAIGAVALGTVTVLVLTRDSHDPPASDLGNKNATFRGQ